MITAEEAQTIIFKETPVLDEELIPLSGLCRRYASRDIRAGLSLPPFDNSAMDGFGVRRADTLAATQERPIALKVTQTIAAGDTPAGQLKAGEAVRIMTGAPIPAGADAVIPIEEVIAREGLCLISEPIANPQHIRFSGEDIQEGEIAVATGTRLTPRHIALLASLGMSRVPVRRWPHVAILATGSELITAGQFLKAGQIYNSNGPTLQTLLSELGPQAEILGQTDDSRERLAATIGETLRSGKVDVLITMGGVSAGDFDLIPGVLEELGAKQLFHKVSVKPGKPLLFAVHKKTLIFGLPGNPVSSYMVYDRFIRPALLKMMGAVNETRVRRTAIVEGDLKGAEGKDVYLRGVVAFREGRYHARSAGPQDSARLVPLACANAVLFIPSSKKKIPSGEIVEFEFFEEVL